MDNNQNIEHTETEISLRQIVDFVLRYWYWFMISVIVCLAAGFVFTKSLTNIYLASASVRIDEEYKRDAASDITNFATQSMFRSTSSVDNEVMMLKSRTLMGKVASNLKANIAYYGKGKLRYVEMYNLLAPIELVVLDTIIKPFDANLQLISADKYKVSVDDGHTIECNYGENVAMDGVSFKVLKRTRFADNESLNDVVVRVNTMPKVVNLLSTMLTIAPASKTTSVIAISMTAPVAQNAVDIINNLVDIYNYDAIEDKRLVAINTSNFINERLRVVDSELMSVDSDVESFKKDNRSVDIASETGIFLESANQYEQQTVDVATQINLVDAVGEYLNKYREEDRLLPTNIGIEDSGLNRSIDSYNQMVIQRDRLSGDGSVDANPIIKELNAQIKSMQQSLRESIANLRNTLGVKQSALARQESRVSGKVRNVPTLEKQGQAIMRQQKIKESIYMYLLNKREETGLKLAASVPIAKVIDTAISSEKPVSPKVSLILMIAFVLGLVIPAVVLILAEQLRTTVCGRGDVEKIVKAPIIGEIPTKPNSITGDKVVSSTSRDIVSESFRIVRTNLDFMLVGGEKEGSKVVMMTSTAPGDGKTYLSINLALMLSITGKRVLLVDLDLRKSTIAKKFNVEGVQGITSLLAGKEDDVLSLIHKGKLDDVDILFAGVVPPNPAELLVNKRLDKIFDILRGAYDYIIVDTSPVGLVADTVIANRLADATIYAIRTNHTDRRSLSSVQQLWQNDTLKNMSLIITDSGVGAKYGYGKSAYGYGYGYHYGYGHGYQYSNDDDTVQNGDDTLFARIKRVFKR